MADDDDDTRREFHRLTELFREKVPGDNPLFTVAEALSQSWGEGYLRTKQALAAMQWLHTQAQIEGFFEDGMVNDDGDTEADLKAWDDFATRVHGPTDLASSISIVVGQERTTFLLVGTNGVTQWTTYQSGYALAHHASGTADGLARALSNLLSFADGPSDHTQTEIAIEELCFSLLGFRNVSPGPAIARARLRQARWGRDLARRRAKREAASEKSD